MDLEEAQVAMGPLDSENCMNFYIKFARFYCFFKIKLASFASFELFITSFY